MKINKISALAFLLFAAVHIVSAQDTQLLMPCGGDGQLIINCAGDTVEIPSLPSVSANITYGSYNNNVLPANTSNLTGQNETENSSKNPINISSIESKPNYLNIWIFVGVIVLIFIVIFIFVFRRIRKEIKKSKKV